MIELLVEKVEAFRNVLVLLATGESTDPLDFKKLRAEIVSHPLLKDVTPRFIRTCRTPGEFWQFIKYESPSYAGRRKFIWDGLRPMFERIEGAGATPAESNVSAALEKFDTSTVHQIWLKALERRESEPEGAITLARTLLETVCKHILDDRGQHYEPDSDLPGLYKMAAKTLNLAPNQHLEPIFRQILGGCTSVVEGLGAMRNRLSDAHGQGKKPIKPAARHAELAVNLSGAMAIFLVDTHSARGAEND